MDELIKLVEECNDYLKGGKTVGEALRTIYERLSNVIDEEITSTYKMTEEEAKEHFKEFIDVWEIGKDISFSSLGKLDKDWSRVNVISEEEYKDVMKRLEEIK
jgi:hypothetical protein